MFYDPRLKDHGLPHDPITALVIPRPIGWITTLSAAGIVNLAPYSYFNLIAGKPPFVMFSSEPAKDTQHNAEATGEFVFNLATYPQREEMNATAAALPPEVSEVDLVGIAMLASVAVRPPRVAASPVHLECKYCKTIDLVGSDGSRAAATMVIGEVVGIHIADEVIVDGIVDVRRMRPIARLGYMQYAVVEDCFEMCKPGEGMPKVSTVMP